MNVTVVLRVMRVPVYFESSYSTTCFKTFNHVFLHKMRRTVRTHLETNRFSSINMF